jgi:hypothetical protein
VGVDVVAHAAARERAGWPEALQAEEHAAALR